MFLVLDTSTPICQLLLVSGERQIDGSWQSGHNLSDGLLEHIQNMLVQNQLGWDDLTGLVVYKGPGSFTGLRIGCTVANSIAYARSLPIVGQTGTDWQQQGLDRLKTGQSDGIVLPEYGSEANITVPRK